MQEFLKGGALSIERQSEEREKIQRKVRLPKELNEIANQFVILTENYHYQALPRRRSIECSPLERTQNKSGDS